jgi:hypothetical protein
MLWVRTAQQLSSNNPLPESIQTIHEKIYAEEKTKRIRFSDRFGGGGWPGLCESRSKKKNKQRGRHLPQ